MQYRETIERILQTPTDEREHEKVGKLMELDTQVIPGIMAKLSEVKRAWTIPGKLSDIGLRLSAYNIYLAEHLGEARAERERTRGKRYLDLIDTGMSSTQATETSRAETAELHGQIIKLELLHKDVNTMISMIQSRLRVMESEGRNQA